jgi:hypothetical protein
MKQPGEFERFDKAMDTLLKIPRSQIKAQLDAEKAEKKRKPKTSALVRASRAKDSAATHLRNSA